jgi:hypothetical protein
MTTTFDTWNRQHPSEMGIDELTDILDTLNAMHEDASDSDDPAKTRALAAAIEAILDVRAARNRGGNNH